MGVLFALGNFFMALQIISIAKCNVFYPILIIKKILLALASSCFDDGRRQRRSLEITSEHILGSRRIGIELRLELRMHYGLE